MDGLRAYDSSGYVAVTKEIELLHVLRLCLLSSGGVFISLRPPCRGIRTYHLVACQEGAKVEDANDVENIWRVIFRQAGVVSGGFDS